MAAERFGELARETIQEIRDFRHAGRGNLPSWARVNVDEFRAAAAHAVEDEDWDRLAELAGQEKRARREDLDEMARRQERIARLLGRADDLIAEGGAGRRHPPGDALQDQIMTGLLARGIGPDDARTMLSRFARRDRREAGRAIRAAARSSAEHLNQLANEHAIGLMGATLAVAVARFNQEMHRGAAPSMAPGAFCLETSARLEEAERAVYLGLRSPNLRSAWAAATNLADLATGMLFDGALPLAASAAIRRRAANAHPAAEGRTALQLGELLRHLLRAVALGQQVAWLTAWPRTNDETRRWTGAARRFAYQTSGPTPLPIAIPVAIAELAATPAAFDGQTISVEGILSPVGITQRGRTSVSTAMVGDGAGRSVAISVPAIRLDGDGMTTGAYVRVGGVWRQAWFGDDDAALRVVRHDPEIEATTWSEWASGRLRRIFAAAPLGLDAQWSWEPGRDGPGNPLRYGSWFLKPEENVS